MIYRKWQEKYEKICKDFGYSQNEDKKSAILLNSFITNSSTVEKISEIIRHKDIFVIGSGPSLPKCIPILKKFKKPIKIVADSALSFILENRIIPDIVITDLDGDLDSLKKISKKSMIVVHAHADNYEKLEFVKNFKNFIGTTQTKSFGKLSNFGGFTDGDRGVFLASNFHAKKIILFGMDLENKIGKYSNTKRTQRKIKLKKLKEAKTLLQWLSTFSKSQLFTTSNSIKGFTKVRYSDLDYIIT